MRLKKNILLLLLLLLICFICTLCAYAYFIDEGKKNNDFSIGRNSIDIEEDYNPPSELHIDDNVFKKEVSIVNTGNVDCYVRVFADFSDSFVKENAFLSSEIENNPPSVVSNRGSWRYDENVEGVLVYYYDSITGEPLKNVPIDIWSAGTGPLHEYFTGSYYNEYFKGTDKEKYSVNYADKYNIVYTPNLSDYSELADSMEKVISDDLAYQYNYSYFGLYPPLIFTDYTDSEGKIYLPDFVGNDVNFLFTASAGGRDVYPWFFTIKDGYGVVIEAYSREENTTSSGSSLGGDPLYTGSWVKATDFRKYPPKNWVYVSFEENPLLGGYYYYTIPLKPNESTSYLIKTVDVVFDTVQSVQDFDIIISADSVQTLDTNGNKFNNWQDCWQEFLDRK